MKKEKLLNSQRKSFISKKQIEKQLKMAKNSKVTMNALKWLAKK